MIDLICRAIRRRWWRDALAEARQRRANERQYVTDYLRANTTPVTEHYGYARWPRTFGYIVVDISDVLTPFGVVGCAMLRTAVKRCQELEAARTKEGRK